MTTIPKPYLIIGYREFFDSDVPAERLNLLQGLCKRAVIAEIAGLNYRLKNKKTMYQDASLESQIRELRYFCPLDSNLHSDYLRIVRAYIKSDKDYPLIFTRQTCLFSLEEIIQSDLPTIENFDMSRAERWDALFRYILAVNNVITEIEVGSNEIVNFETLNPKMLPLNELGLTTNPLFTIYRGLKLLTYLSTQDGVGEHVVQYFVETYTTGYDEFVYEILSMYAAKNNDNDHFDFFYRVGPSILGLFQQLSQRYSSTEVHKLLSIRKFPFFQRSNEEFFLLDNILLVEKTYNQFINDFWFDHLSLVADSAGKKTFNIKGYKSIIGYFFECYVEEIIRACFSATKFYTVKLFGELKFKGNELADVYIRYHSKILLGQVKVTSIYDREKYEGNIDGLYRENRAAFFDGFGVGQLVSSLKDLETKMPFLDATFPKNRRLKVFPVIIVNEKALQTPLMGKVFQDRFSELTQGIGTSKFVVYPLSIIHISDLENIQDYIYNRPNNLWQLLQFHCRFPHFMPPFYNSVNRKDIRPSLRHTQETISALVEKFHNPIS